MHHLLARCAAAWLCATSIAQVNPGDLAITGFSSTSFGLLAGGPNSQTIAVGSFQGSGLGWSQTVLADPTNGNGFYVGGFGFVGYAAVTGSGSATYVLLSNQVGIAVQLSLDDSGQLIVVDAGTSQVRRLDPSSGNVIDVSVGAQPWGTDASSGAFDPVTGDVVVGGDGGVYRLAAGSTLATTVVTGLGGFVSGIAFDPIEGDILATVLTSNRVVRIDASGTVTDVAPAGSVPGPNALDLDSNGDLITGGGTGQVWRVPRLGGAPVPLGNHTGPLNGIAVAGGSGFGRRYGSGCQGAAGPSVLSASGPFAIGANVVTTSSGHAANTIGILVLGLSRTSYAGLPLPFLLDPVLGTSNCSLLASLDATLAGVASATNPSSLAIAFTVPPSFAGQTLYGQHAVLAPVPGGLSWSNGLMLRFP